MNASAETTIRNKYGFHARPSTSFSALAREYSSEVQVTVGGISVDGKSVMGLMSLGAPQGTVISISTSGDDAEEALAALVAHVDERFGGID